MTKVLVNKKTGKEFKTTDPEAVLNKYPKTFRVKPAVQLNKEVAKVDDAIKDIEVKDAQVELPKKAKKAPKKEDKE